MVEKYEQHLQALSQKHAKGMAVTLQKAKASRFFYCWLRVSNKAIQSTRKKATRCFYHWHAATKIRAATDEATKRRDEELKKSLLVVFFLAAAASIMTYNSNPVSEINSNDEDLAEWECNCDL